MFRPKRKRCHKLMHHTLLDIQTVPDLGMAFGAAAQGPQSSEGL